MGPQISLARMSEYDATHLCLTVPVAKDSMLIAYRCPACAYEWPVEDCGVEGSDPESVVDRFYESGMLYSWDPTVLDDALDMAIEAGVLHADVTDEAMFDLVDSICAVLEETLYTSENDYYNADPFGPSFSNYTREALITVRQLIEDWGIANPPRAEVLKRKSMLANMLLHQEAIAAHERQMDETEELLDEIDHMLKSGGIATRHIDRAAGIKRLATPNLDKLSEKYRAQVGAQMASLKQAGQERPVQDRPSVFARVGRWCKDLHVHSYKQVHASEVWSQQLGELIEVSQQRCSCGACREALRRFTPIGRRTIRIRRMPEGAWDIEGRAALKQLGEGKAA